MLPGRDYTKYNCYVDTTHGGTLRKEPPAFLAALSSERVGLVYALVFPSSNPGPRL